MLSHYSSIHVLIRCQYILCASCASVEVAPDAPTLKTTAAGAASTAETNATAPADASFGSAAVAADAGAPVEDPLVIEADDPEWLAWIKRSADWSQEAFGQVRCIHACMATPVTRN